MDGAYAGQEALCGVCRGRTIVPNRNATASSPAVVNYRNVPTSVTSDDRMGIVVPVLISAIGNIVVGLIWISTVCGAVLAVPMFILCIFEFIFYSESDRLARSRFTSKAKTIGIFEIILGLFNMVSLIAGIIVLINLGRYKRRSQV